MGLARALFRACARTYAIVYGNGYASNGLLSCVGFRGNVRERQKNSTTRNNRVSSTEGEREDAGNGSRIPHLRSANGPHATLPVLHATDRDHAGQGGRTARSEGRFDFVPRMDERKRPAGSGRKIMLRNVRRLGPENDASGTVRALPASRPSLLPPVDKHQDGLQKRDGLKGKSGSTGDAGSSQPPIGR